MVCVHEVTFSFKGENRAFVEHGLGVSSPGLLLTIQTYCKPFIEWHVI